MNVVDSSGWLEYFADGKNANFFASPIEDTKNLVVPVICIYEVFKRILQQSGLSEAQLHISDMHQGEIVELNASLAMTAAKLSTELKLPMADSIILAVTYAKNATLWTQDEHFKHLEGVKYIAKG